MEWLKAIHFEHFAQQETFIDYFSEVEHGRARIQRLERSIDRAIETVPASMQAVISGLQALRGVAKITAVTIVAEVGSLSRFNRAKQLMGYSGAVPSEHSSGNSLRRGGITKTGNAHLRRVIGEAAFAYKHRPDLYKSLRRRQVGTSECIKEIAWKAQHRLHQRYWRLAAKGKTPAKIVTAIGRELLGFVWAIGVEAERTAAEQTRIAA
jgi:transposase